MAISKQFPPGTEIISTNHMSDSQRKYHRVTEDRHYFSETPNEFNDKNYGDEFSENVVFVTNDAGRQVAWSEIFWSKVADQMAMPDIDIMSLDEIHAAQELLK